MAHGRLVASLPLLALYLAFPTVPRAGEFFVFAGVAQGSTGGEIDFGTDAQVTGLTYVTGDKLQFRLDTGFLRTRQGALLVSPVGPIPPKPRVRSGQGGGPAQVGGLEAAGGAGPGTGNDVDPTGSDGSTEAIVGEEWESGFGDLRLALSRRLVGGGAKVFRLDLVGQVKAPTADAEKGLGTGEWDGYVGIGGEYRFWSVTGFGGLGWNYLGDPAWVELNDVVDGYLGLESEPLAGRVMISGWVEGNPEVVEGMGPRGALGLGVRGIGKLGWRVLATAGLTDAAQDFSLVLGMSFGDHIGNIRPPGAVR